MQRIGIIGGGQLAWMMADAVRQLDLELVVQTPSAADPAATIADTLVLAPVADPAGTAQLATQSDVITFENEFVDLDALAQLADRGVIFRPRLGALQPLLDKYDQRQFFQQCGIPTPDFASPAPAIPPRLPAVLKTRRMGYDGQGTFIPKTGEAYQGILANVGPENLLWEEFVPFDRELAIMAARSGDGEVVTYPVVETQQENQVCHWVVAPAAVSASVATQIAEIAQMILEKLDLVGILGIELFITADDRVLVNEVAPRTHNSGHYTLDASVTSQFEQQLRAVADRPLGDPSLNCHGALMVNLLGFETATSDYQEQRAALAAIPNAHVYWYGKAQSHPGRKLGHVTVRFLDPDWRSRIAPTIQQIKAIWYPQ